MLTAPHRTAAEAPTAAPTAASHSATATLAQHPGHPHWRTAVPVRRVRAGRPVGAPHCSSTQQPQWRKHHCPVCGKAFGPRLAAGAALRTHGGPAATEVPVCAKGRAGLRAAEAPAHAHGGEGRTHAHNAARPSGRARRCLRTSAHTRPSAPTAAPLRQGLWPELQPAASPAHAHGRRPYACPHCSKAFRPELSGATAPTCAFAGERPYRRCQLCGKAFGQASSLTKHKRVHEVHAAAAAAALPLGLGLQSPTDAKTRAVLSPGSGCCLSAPALALALALTVTLALCWAPSPIPARNPPVALE